MIATQKAVRMRPGRRRGPLASRRAAVGLTQSALAAAVEADRVTVYRWERGEVPSPRYRRPLARALGMSVFELAELLDANAAVVR
jgi:transcriptional regulator with XRE-family HTH domain